MNRQLLLVVCLFAALFCSASSAQAPQGQSPAAQIAALQKEVEALKADVVALKKAKPAGGNGAEHALAEQKRLLDEIVEYLKSQAHSAQSLEQVLAESKEKGFTYGINPDSRIVMLEGFHQFVTTLQANVPGAPKVDAAAVK